MNFAFGVISRFSKFSEFLFWTDRNILIWLVVKLFLVLFQLPFFFFGRECWLVVKLFLGLFQLPFLFFFFFGGGGFKVQTEAIKRKNIDKNLHIFFYFSFRLTKLLLSFLPNTFERLSCPFSKQGIWCIKRYWL